jgi:acetolactate synthase-1/2/3 large subunit
MLTAHGMNAPVLALVGQVPQSDIDRGHGHLHEIHDQLGVARHFTKFAARIGAPHEAPGLVRDALKSACSGRQRPVMLECAMDIWGRQGEIAFPAMPAPIEEPPVDLDAVEAAARLLGAAKRPVIFVGGGAQHASAEVAAIAELLEAPVVGFRRGRGILASSHRLSVTLPIGHRLWAEADAVLAVGTRLHMQQSQWGVDDDLKVVRVDVDPEEPERFRKPSVALVGDSKAYLSALLKRLPSHNAKRAPRTEELAAHRAWLAEKLAKLQPQVGFLEAIRRALPPDGIFVDEVTQVGFAARIAFPVEKPGTFISPGYQDNLGWGLGTALGVKAARPDTPVLAISGDGGFLYQLGELATAAQHGIAVVSVIFDNSAFGNVRLIQRERYGGRHIACDLKNPDFVKLANAFEIAAFRARTPAELETAIKRAFELKAPALVHVPHGETASPWDMILMPKVRGR